MTAAVGYAWDGLDERQQTHPSTRALISPEISRSLCTCVGWVPACGSLTAKNVTFPVGAGPDWAVIAAVGVNGWP